MSITIRVVFFGMPAEPDLAHDVVVELQDGILERRRGRVPFEIEEHPSRILEPLGSIGRLRASSSMVTRTPSGSGVRLMSRIVATAPVGRLAAAVAGSGARRRRLGRSVCSGAPATGAVASGTGVRRERDGRATRSAGGEAARRRTPVRVAWRSRVRPPIDAASSRDSRRRSSVQQAHRGASIGRLVEALERQQREVAPCHSALSQ